MKIIAIIKRAIGNDSVGEIWNETATFDINTPVSEIFLWASEQNNGNGWDKDILITRALKET